MGRARGIGGAHSVPVSTRLSFIVDCARARASMINLAMVTYTDRAVQRITVPSTDILWTLRSEHTTVHEKREKTVFKVTSQITAHSAQPHTGPNPTAKAE